MSTKFLNFSEETSAVHILPANSDICYVGLIDGSMMRVDLSNTDVKEVGGEVRGEVKGHGSKQLERIHQKGIRSITSGSGMLFTGSSDRSICLSDIETGSLVARIKKAHSDSVNVVHEMDENIFVSGDDSGIVKVWQVLAFLTLLLFIHQTLE